MPQQPFKLRLERVFGPPILAMQQSGAGVARVWQSDPLAVIGTGTATTAAGKVARKSGGLAQTATSAVTIANAKTARKSGVLAQSAASAITIATVHRYLRSGALAVAGTAEATLAHGCIAAKDGPLTSSGTATIAVLSSVAGHSGGVLAVTESTVVAVAHSRLEAASALSVDGASEIAVALGRIGCESGGMAVAGAGVVTLADAVVGRRGGVLAVTGSTSAGAVQATGVPSANPSWVTYEAVTAGTAGNALNVWIDDMFGGAPSLTVSVLSNYPSTGRTTVLVEGVVTDTIDDVAAAVAAHPTASTLVTFVVHSHGASQAFLINSEPLGGVVLSGGVDGVVAGVNVASSKLAASSAAAVAGASGIEVAHGHIDATSALAIAGSGTITVAAGRLLPPGGALSVTGAAAISVAGGLRGVPGGSVALSGAGVAQATAAHVAALSGPLQASGVATITVAASEREHVGRPYQGGPLIVEGAGLVTVLRSSVRRKQSAGGYPKIAGRPPQIPASIRAVGPIGLHGLARIVVRNAYATDDEELLLLL